MARYLAIREEFPRETCLFCPVLFDRIFFNSLSKREIEMSAPLEADICADHLKSVYNFCTSCKYFTLLPQP